MSNYDMLLISHRGNLNGPDAAQENSVDHIAAALAAGFDVEVDVWEVDGALFSGHDRPTNPVGLDFLRKNRKKLWIHCKNLAALKFFSGQKYFNYFWHQTDDYTLTSQGFIWTYPGKPVTDKNILVVWEKLAPDALPRCLGICSDYVGDYK